MLVTATLEGGGIDTWSRVVDNMESIMPTVDRLIAGLSGEDPEGACIYIANLRQSEVRGKH